MNELPLTSEWGSSVRGVTYFVNAETGNDSNSGRSEGEAWRSIERANKADFGAGDALLFAGGQTFRGTLTLFSQSSGSASSPLKVSSFGRGRARIDGGKGDGIVLDGCERVQIMELQVAGSGRKRGNNGVGIRLIATKRVDLEDLEVMGFRLAGIQAGGDEDSRMTRVEAHDNGGAGIIVHGGYGDLPRSKRLYIGDCKAYNNAGDPKNLANHSGNGIVIGGVDIALVEYCEAYNNGWDMPREGNGPVGIWAWDADRVVIQHCISHDNKSPGTDGGGFDFDGGVTNSYLQYNLSYNNEGCGYLLCQYPGASRWRDNVIRFNISVNDGSRNMQSGIAVYDGGGKFANAQIYNNTIVNDYYGVNSWNPVKGLVYRNNLFLTKKSALIGEFTGSRFENNLYWNPSAFWVDQTGTVSHADLQTWAETTDQEMREGKLIGKAENPRIVLPDPNADLPTDPRKLRTMTIFRPEPSSPCLGAGMPIESISATDMLGQVLKGNPPIGAISRI